MSGATPAPSSTPPSSEDTPPALCVDLDGTLVRTCTLWEALLLLIRTRPLLAPILPLCLLRGRSHFKHWVARRCQPDAALLPYRGPLLEFLEVERQTGRRLLLVTAADHQIAENVAGHLGLFDRVLASRPGRDLRGQHKVTAIHEEMGGVTDYDYIGDSAADLPVLRNARRAMLAEPYPLVLFLARARGNLAHVFSDIVRPNPLLRALRPHQWAKNALIALPVLAAHRWGDTQVWLSLAVAFTTTSVVASGLYIFNDLLDLDADRSHAKKRERPFAAGEIPVPIGACLGTSLLLIGAGLAYTLLPPLFGLWLAAYTALALTYSFFLKHYLILDVLALASLYVVRVLAGAGAAQVAVSDWLLAFSLFFFLSLALVKRYSEASSEDGAHSIQERGYRAQDAPMLQIAGTAAGYLSILVLALYITGPAVRELYAEPRILWLLTPLLAYWITRVWFLAGRGEVAHDPVAFALSDGPSYAVAAACGLVIFAAAAA